MLNVWIVLEVCVDGLILDDMYTKLNLNVIGSCVFMGINVLSLTTAEYCQTAYEIIWEK